MLQEHCSQLCYQKSRNVDETEAGDRETEREHEHVDKTEAGAFFP